jgi:hypothetical protein
MAGVVTRSVSAGNLVAPQNNMHAPIDPTIRPVRRSMTFWAAKDRFPFVDFRRLDSEHVSVETVTIDWRDLDS